MNTLAKLLRTPYFAGPIPLPGQEPPVQDPDPFAPPPPVEDPGSPAMPRREPGDPPPIQDPEHLP